MILAHWGKLAAAALLLWGSAGWADGSAPQNGACFGLDPDGARLCVPVRFSLIDLGVDGTKVWAHFEDRLEAVTIYMNAEPLPQMPPLDGFPEALEGTHLHGDVESLGTRVERFGSVQVDTITVHEALSSADDVAAYHIEITRPEDNMFIILTDFSPEFDDTLVDFHDTISEIRHLLHFQRVSLGTLSPFEALERVQ
ncbi:hypothetical protein [Gymnodinialimonas sp.]